MGCCEKQAVETAVFCWASGPITWPQPGPVGTFLWTSSAVPVTFPLGSSPLLPPSLALSRKPTVAPPLRSPNLVERSKGAGGPERTRGRVAWSGGADQGFAHASRPTSGDQQPAQNRTEQGESDCLIKT